MNTPPLVLCILLGLLCFFGTYKGIQELGIVAMIALPLVVAFGFFIAFGNIQHKDYSMLLPIAEHGPGPIIKGTTYVFSGLTELSTLLFLVHYTNKPLKWKHIVLVAFILMGLMLGPLMAAIAETDFSHSIRLYIHLPTMKEQVLLAVFTVKKRVCQKLSS
jgi:hypothetical protein